MRRKTIRGKDIKREEKRGGGKGRRKKRKGENNIRN